MSIYVSNVYKQLVTAYYSKQDWANFYTTADQALAKNGDDVDVLTLVSWVIPHSYNSKDPDADKKLDMAETYEKRALGLIPNLPKPVTMSDDQFASAKARELSQAHSGLEPGLLPARRCRQRGQGTPASHAVCRDGRSDRFLRAGR